ncbi:Na+/H+ antiporter subunit B [Algiphilus sp.]|uniref:Na+/H+ antiporter subunit B n=1 Tax=Algiphilus sp. TaxID=1872431 RepID=UPI0025C23B8E|nr:Na+/H+ antiporter subunit B [Algiphilus sp.]MCK5770747.1 Na+/H+ antiporter subunit B [Algiphilus sp.]
MSASLILRAAGQVLLPLLMVLSIYLLLRGHNEPGGGFIAGLVAASAISLKLFAADIRSARGVLRVDPRRLVGIGLLVALLAAMMAPFSGKGTLFQGLWVDVALPVVGKTHLGTPLLFDVGVYLVVIGAVLIMVLTLAETEG